MSDDEKDRKIASLRYELERLYASRQSLIRSGLEWRKVAAMGIEFLEHTNAEDNNPGMVKQLFDAFNAASETDALEAVDAEYQETAVF